MNPKIIPKTYPLVSVIIPIYNVEPFLETCIASISKQSHANLEMILINDGSTDGCGRICRESAKQEKRIQVIEQENAGVSSARNAGLKIAQGEFVLFVDPDDWIERNAIEKLVTGMTSDDIDLVIGSFSNILFEDEKIVSEIPVHFDRGFKTSEQFACIAGYDSRLDTGNSYDETALVFGRLYRRSILEKHSIHFNEKLFLCEDLVFSLEYFSVIEKVLVLDDILYKRRRWTGSTTTSSLGGKDRFLNSELTYQAISEIFDRWNATGLSSKIKDEAERSLKSLYAQQVIGSILRLFSMDNNLTFQEKTDKIRSLSRQKIIQDSLACYQPPQGYSRSVPFLLRNQLPLLTAWAAWFIIVWKKFFR